MDIIEGLQDKNAVAAHELLLELEERSAQSGELYEYFDKFAALIHHKSSFVRSRGFRLCCAQAKWDSQNKLNESISELLSMLEDSKPTAVRQCLAALHTAIRYKPELCEPIRLKLEALNLSEYKDSMRPLLENDIAQLKKRLK